MIPTTRHPQYITNESGEKIAVVLPVEEFEARIEDFEDLAAAAERRDESSNSHEAVVAALKADGFYQVRWKAPAEKELRKLPKEVISRIVAAVKVLADNPIPSGAGLTWTRPKAKPRALDVGRQYLYPPEG